MAYIVTKTNGQILATIKDGTVDTSTSLKLVGKNYIGYGELIAENLLHLLENFAAADAPVAPILGQIWFDSANKRLGVYTGSEFTPLLKSVISSTQPTVAVEGDGWWNTQTKKFNVYDGATWQQIGPLDTSPFARLTQNNQFTGNITVNQTLFVGNTQTALITISPAGTATLKNNTAEKNLLLGTTLANGSEAVAITISGITGRAEVTTPQNATEVANKEYVDLAVATINNSLSLVDSKTDNIGSDLISSVSNLATLIAQLQQDKANINSAALTGAPTVPTPALNTTTKQIVNAEFVQNNLSLKASLASPVFTGIPQAPTAAAAENSNVLATTAFVKNHCGIEVLNNAVLTGTPTAPTKPGADNSTAIATTAFVHSLLPRGVVLMWSGSIIPVGWALCDGANGTPDLRNKFIVGSGSSYALGTTGGASSSSATTQAAGSHNHSGSTQSHTLTVEQIPAHSHDTYVGNGTVDVGGFVAGGLARTQNFSNQTFNTGGSQGHSHNISNDGNHTHAISPIATIPPYYALAYIMKVY